MKKFLLAWVVFVTTSLNALAQHTIEGTVVERHANAFVRCNRDGREHIQRNCDQPRWAFQPFGIRTKGRIGVLEYWNEAVHQQVGKAKACTSC